MAWEFKVGDQVKCVRANFGLSYIEITPEVGGEYTIRSILSEGGLVGLRFVEIVNTHKTYVTGVKEVAFDINSFRPIRNTDISSLQEHLLMKPVKQLERIGARDE